MVVLVSSRLDVVAAVVSVTAARFWLPELDSVTARWTVSPGTRPLAATVSRLLAEPAAPRPIVTVPDATEALADVLEVNEPNVPRPATLAAAATTAAEARTLARVVVRTLRRGPDAD